MRITYLIDSLKIGGAEVQLLTFLQSCPAGMQFSVAYFTDGPLRKEVEALQIPTIRLATRGLLDPQALPRLLAHLRGFQPHILHTHLAKSDLYGAFSAPFSPAPRRISTLHNVSPWRQNPVYSAISRWSTRPYTRIIAVSKTVRDYTIQWSKFPAEKVVILDNGVDVQKFDPERAYPCPPYLANLPAGAPRIGVIGRLEPQKGLDIFLEAAAIIRRAAPEVVFIIAGDGSLRQTLEAQRDQLGLSESVYFTGSRQEIPPFLAHLDVAAISSRYEGLPLVLLEAMAMARPVVATSVGGVPDVIEDGRNGLLVPPEDPQKLADGLLKLVSNRQLGSALGQAARHTVVERFSQQNYWERLMNLYSEFVARA